MSLHYLLDGYNIVHQMPASSQAKLGDLRQNLLHYIELNRPQGSERNKVTVIFDGYVGQIDERKTSCVNIIFSQDISADNKIKDIVNEAKNKKNIVVVSDDKDIRIAVRAEGAAILSVKEFLAQGKKASMERVRGKSDSTGKNISKTLEYKINSELREIWLNEK